MYNMKADIAVRNQNHCAHLKSNLNVKMRTVTIQHSPKNAFIQFCLRCHLNLSNFNNLKLYKI